MLGLGRAAMPRRSTLQSSDQIVVQITDMQVPTHPALHATIDLNDLTRHEVGQDPGAVCRWASSIFRAAELFAATMFRFHASRSYVAPGVYSATNWMRTARQSG